MTARPGPRSDPYADLRTRLATLPEAAPSSELGEAAVLILLRIGPSGPEVLAEQRAVRPGDPWSGQVGLPGGRTDPGDRTLAETALRELREELRLLPEALDGVPRLFDVRRARPAGLRVGVFVSRYVGNSQDYHEVDPEEVAAAFWFPLDALENRTQQLRQTSMGEIHVDTVEFEGHIVWGFTLRLLLDFQTWLRSPQGASQTRRVGSRRTPNPTV